MLPLIVPIGALLTGVALLLLGSGLLNTLLALRAGIEGYSDGALGIIMSGYFLGFFIGTFLALPLIQRMGHIRTFAFCAALAACAALLHVIFINPVSWLLLRILVGSVLVILYTVIESWLNGQTPSQNRGKVFSVYMAVNLGALALAQQLLRLDTPSGFILFAVSAMLLSVSLLPITWTRLAQPEISHISRLRLQQLYRTAPIAVAGAVLSGLAMGAFWGLGALYAREIGLDDKGVAMFMSCTILGGAVFQLPLGRYSDSHDRRKVLTFVSVLAAVAATSMQLISDHFVLALITAAFYGGMAFAVYPVAVAHLIDHLEPQNILSGGSGLLLLHGIGAACGPALAGQLMELHNASVLPLYFAIMQLILAGITVWHLHQTKTEEPLESPAHFVPMVRTTPTALEMLPDEQSQDTVTATKG